MVTVDIIHGVAVLKIQSKTKQFYTKSKSHKNSLRTWIIVV